MKKLVLCEAALFAGIQRWSGLDLIWPYITSRQRETLRILLLSFVMIFTNAVNTLSSYFCFVARELDNPQHMRLSRM